MTYIGHFNDMKLRGKILFLARFCLVAAFLGFSLTHGSSSVLAQMEGDEGPVITGARVAGDNVRTRFILDMNRNLTVSISGLAEPYRLILDMSGARFDLPENLGSEGRGLISAWRYGSIAPGKSRIVLDADGPVAIDRTFMLPSVDNQPARFVVDLVKSTPSDFQDFADSTRDRLRAARTGSKGDRLRRKSSLDDRPLIVLDPGHGGIDTGAKGVGGTLEKTVVFDFSSILKRKLEETGRYTVHLTREDDTFIPLGERVRIGHDLEADLFISIHADSVRRGGRYVRGATVYTLSDKASDDLAQELAESENMSDIIAGVELQEEPTEVTDILLDLARRETRNFSVFFARTLVTELKSAVRVIKNPHRSAGFRVLKAHDVPSVLVELGYLSNEHDEKLLVSNEWRERMAAAMVAAVEKFFRPRLAQGAEAAMQSVGTEAH